MNLTGFGTLLHFPDLVIKFVDKREIGFDSIELVFKTTPDLIYKDLLEMGFDYDKCFQIAVQIVNQNIVNNIKLANEFFDKRFDNLEQYLDSIQLRLETKIQTIEYEFNI